MRMLPLSGAKTLVVKARKVDVRYVTSAKKYYLTDDVQLLFEEYLQALTFLTGPSFIS